MPYVRYVWHIYLILPAGQQSPGGASSSACEKSSSSSSSSTKESTKAKEEQTSWAMTILEFIITVIIEGLAG